MGYEKSGLLGKTAYSRIETKYGAFKCSQLFTPKLNESAEDQYFAQRLAGMYASLKLHFRDAPDGQIYLQCSYCDLYARQEPKRIEPDCSKYDPSNPVWF